MRCQACGFVGGGQLVQHVIQVAIQQGRQIVRSEFRYIFLAGIIRSPSSINRKNKLPAGIKLCRFFFAQAMRRQAFGFVGGGQLVQHIV